MKTKTHNIIALDVGEKRVGVALANTVARLPHPLTTLVRDTNFWDALAGVLGEHQPETVVVGLPRNLEGNDTLQTQETRSFVRELEQRLGYNVHLQDEALTSKKAEQYLNKYHKTYTRADIDARAAAFILEDYLTEESR